MSDLLRALAWKEIRAALAPVATVLAGLAVLTLTVHALGWGSGWRGMLSLGLAPLAGAYLGALALAGERSERTLGYLLARPVEPARILRVKLAVLGGAAGLVLAACLVLGGGLHQLRFGGSWSRAMEGPFPGAWLLGLGLTAALFLAGFAASLVLDDSVTPVPVGVLVGAAWSALALGPAFLLGGSMLEAVAAPAAQVPPLAAGPALLAWLAARRFGPDPPRPVTRRAGAMLAAGGALAAAGFALGLDAPLEVRAVHAGRATVLGAPLLPHPVSPAVAFVAVPPNGPPRTVIATPGDGGGLTVFPRGTEPLGWLAQGDALVVRWPRGRRRVVGPSGRTRLAGRREAPAPSDPAPELRLIDGRLVRQMPAGTVTLYPFDEPGP